MEMIINGNRGTAVIGARGVEVGRKFLCGSMAASEVRSAGRALGLSGNKLNEYVRRAYANEAGMRAASLAVAVEGLKGQGFHADAVVVRKASATISLVKPKEGKVSQAESKRVEDLERQLANMREMLAKLQGQQVVVDVK